MTKLEIALEALHNISNFDKTQCESFVKGIEDMREIADKALEQINTAIIEEKDGKYTEEQQISDIGFILNQHKGYVNANFITVIMLETDKKPIYTDVVYDKDGVDNKEFIQKIKKHALHKLEEYIEWSGQISSNT